MAEYGLPGMSICGTCGLARPHLLCGPPRLRMAAGGLTASEGTSQRTMSRSRSRSQEPDMSPHPRYRLLERIGQGGMGEVFRAHDRLTGQFVALKRVSMPLRALPEVLALPGEKGQTQLGLAATLAPQARTLADGDPRAATGSSPRLGQSFRGANPAADGNQDTGADGNQDTGAAVFFAPKPSPETEALRVCLTHEFRTLAGLRYPHIVSVLDYGFDPSHQPYFTMELLEAAVPLDQACRGQAFPMRVGFLLQLLQALTYLHRRGVLHRDLKPGNTLVIPGPIGPQVKLLDFGLALFSQGRTAQRAEVAGTIGYIAPEVLLGAPASEAADLFAVGVIAHEVLIGSHPLGALPTAALIQEFLGPSPIFSEDMRLDSALAEVLRRALCRDPGERYATASEFAQDLARATGLLPPIETTEIRDSFLQAASFVARDAELATLRRALDEAAAQKGAVWLIGGESGVGKSRLLDELRTLALVRGVRVVRGQAVSAGGSAYQVWLGALRPLCLDAVLDDLDAGVLRAVVPDMPMLLGRPVPEPPALDSQNAQARFLLAVEKLLLSQREPLVLLLEDLHWAEPASLAVLQRLVRSVARRPLLVVGSYRQDERPTLADEIPGAQLLPLHRLSVDELMLLSTSMLGEVGRSPEVVKLLERETEGNAFFIVEVVRALAEEVGTLAKIGVGGLPSQVLAGGMQAVLARRLVRVPDAIRPLLYAAAVLGRELDLVVLKALPGTIGDQLEPHLAACASLAVLEVSENGWRFSHDKLREALLTQLPAAERARWHHQVGSAIEQAYAADLAPHASALAYHFAQANDPARAVPYGLQAGEHAMRGGAGREAIGLFERALGQLAQLPESESRSRSELSLRVPQAIAIGLVHGYAAAQTEQALLRCLTQCQRLGSGPELLPTLFGLWQSNILRGRAWRARDYVTQILQQGSHAPGSDADLAAKLMQQVTCVFLGELVAARQHAETLLGHYRRDRHQRLTYLYGVDFEVMSRVHLGHSLWLLGDETQAAAQYHKTLDCARALGHPYSLSFALYGLVAFYQSHGDSAAVRHYLVALRALAEQHGYRHTVLQCEFMDGWVLAKQGQLTAGLALMQRTIETRRRTGAMLSLTHLLAIMAEIQLASGQHDSALATVKDAQALIAEGGERAFAANVLRVYGEILICRSRGAWIDFPVDNGPDDLLLRSLDIARSQSAGLAELRSVLSLGHLWKTQGNEEEARRMLKKSLDRYHDTLHPSDRNAAQILLEELSS